MIFKNFFAKIQKRNKIFIKIDLLATLLNNFIIRKSEGNGKAFFEILKSDHRQISLNKANQFDYVISNIEH